MALPVTIPNTFANATSSIPLSQLDANFGTLANAVNGLNSGSETLANLKATTANVGVLTVTGNATIGDASTDTVTLNSTLTANTVVIFAAGTSAAPSITTTGDLNTGIFFPAADTIAFAEGGAEAMRIDSSGNVGIGTASPSGSLDIQSTSGDSYLRRFAASTSGPTYYFDKSRNATVGSNTIVQSGDTLGRILWRGANGTGYTTAAEITAEVDGTPGASNDMPGRILFLTTPDGSGTLTERMRIDSSGNVGIGVTPSAWGSTWKALQISSWAALGAETSSSGECTLLQNAYASGTSTFRYISSFAATRYTLENSDHKWFTAPSGTAGNTITWTERARITSGGDFFVAKTSSNVNADGCELGSSGYISASRNAAVPIFANRNGDDGVLVSFRQAGTEEGTISVSGATVSYNAFCGSHWSQLQEGRGHNPDIPRGTVLSSIGEMSEWKSVEWTETIEHPAIPAVEAKESVLDEEGNVIEPAVEAVEGKDAWTESINKRDTYLGNLPIGATFEEDGFTKTVVDDGNERLPKVKISDVVGDKAVYGVFQTWDDAQDMLVSSLGAFVVRIAAGVTVQIGDLLESNGDGCAKVQDDDVIRSKTIGKVTSTVATNTYADGSYTVPCVLYCG